MEDKLKHLDFTQAIINRMAQNSFQVKAWTITIITALFAFADKDNNPKYIVIAYFPLFLFWILDAYYLYQERLFRKVYDHVRKQSTSDFSLDTSGQDTGITGWVSAAFSRTIFFFYAIILVPVTIIAFKAFFK